MATLRLLLAGALACAAIAGCAEHQASNLEPIYGNDLGAGNGTTLPGIALPATLMTIQGSHIEARFNDGAWGTNATRTIDGGKVDSPAPAANPLGGGGETTALPPVDGNATLELRISEADRLSGYTALWYFTSAGSNGTTPVALPANAAFETHLGPGPFTATVVLSRSNAPADAVAAYAPLPGAVRVHYVATGDVQPMWAGDPTGLGLPGAMDSAGQRDVYTLTVGAGVPISMHTTYAGNAGPTDGTDVGIAIVGSGGAETAVACQDGAASTIPGPSPDQADEATTGVTDAAGTWNLWVGNIEGCQGNTGYTYTNPGPVAYSLDVLVG